MKLKLLVTIDSFHLEDALFCAEQSIASGADILELGSTLIKNSGLQCIRIFCERFPELFVVADLKTIGFDFREIKGAKEAGAAALTVSGAINEKNWQQCLDQAKECGLKTFLDYRQLSLPVIHRQIFLAGQADCVMLDLSGKDEPITAILQEIAFHYQVPVAINFPDDLANLENLRPLGVSMLGVRLCGLETQNIKEIIQNAKDAIENVQERICDLSNREYSEQILREKLQNLCPEQICEAMNRRMVLENVHPLQRFTRVAGRATTIKLGPGSCLGLPKFLLGIPAGNIVLIDACGESGAVWNSLCTSIALKQKLAGAVIYGAINVNHAHNKGFPCYIASLSPMPAFVHAGMTPLGEIPLQIGSLTVNPGDWLIGDDSGIVCVPADEIFQIADRALQLVKHRENLSLQIENTNDPKVLKKLIDEYQQNRLPKQ